MRIENPGKYQSLGQVAALNIKTPATLLLTAQDLFQQNFEAKLIQFLKDFKTDFIVRSAVSAEDCPEKSLAGHFYSSQAVPATEVLATVNQAWRDNQTQVQKFGLKASVNLMVQPFYKAQLGGVVFTEWKYFSGVMVITFSQNPQAAVEGRDSQAVLIDENGKIYSESIKPVHAEILHQLHASLVKVRKKFGAVDIEWLYSKSQGIVILQMRPITVPLGFLQAAPEKFRLNTKAELKQIEAGSWQQNELSENIGALSPLSFSLLKHLYHQAIPTLNTLGLQAPSMDWLQRAPNGQLFCARELYQNFFSYPSWWSPFKMAFKSVFLEQELKNFLADYQALQNFSLPHLQTLFNYWLVINVKLSLNQQSVLPTSAVIGDYELARVRKTLPTAPLNLKASTYPDLNYTLKGLFFQHLERLKEALLELDEVYFKTWEEFSYNKDVPDLDERRALDLKHSVYYLPAQLEESKVGGQNFISSIRTIKGVVWHPSQSAVLPDNAVYYGEVFSNQHVSLIPKLQGIIVKMGSPLSHSAIVAREHNIPYLIDNLNDYKIGDSVLINKTSV